jgi:hypothetical protein
LTKQPPSDICSSETDDNEAGVPQIEVTPEMISAGEEVLDRAFLNAELPPSWSVYSAVRDVYIAMHQASGRPGGCDSSSCQGEEDLDGQ